MKRFIPILMLLAAFPLAMTLFSPAGFAFDLEAKGFSQAENPVEVYYFHRNRRCGPCRTIENLTKKTVESHYADALEKGSVIFHVINVETPGNEEIAARFRVNGVAVIVSGNNGAEEKTTNFTAMAYRHSSNEDAFITELKKVIDETLKP
jgi:thiol-disulfide isomerase/thioredoxin